MDQHLLAFTDLFLQPSYRLPVMFLHLLQLIDADDSSFGLLGYLGSLLSDHMMERHLFAQLLLSIVHVYDAPPDSFHIGRMVLLLLERLVVVDGKEVGSISGELVVVFKAGELVKDGVEEVGCGAVDVDADALLVDEDAIALARENELEAVENASV